LRRDPPLPRELGDGPRLRQSDAEHAALLAAFAALLDLLFPKSPSRVYPLA